MARDPKTLTQDFTDVMRLVYLAMMMDIWDMEAIRVQLLRIRRRVYEDELMIQAARAGCKGKTARLTNGSILSELNQMCINDALSIINTYNYDLAAAIIKIRSEHPRANRNQYASYLQEWHEKRNAWKNAQIAQYTESSTRSKAQQDFFAYNIISGVCVLVPKTAICPVCQGWIERGEIPLRVAMNNPPPYHLNCPHGWETYPNKATKEECQDLWMGGE